MSAARFTDRPAFSSIGEAGRMALANLWANKLRSTLTIVGIVIGVTAIVGMTALVRGLDESITGEIESIGADHLFLRKWGGRIVASEREFLRLERRPNVTREDLAEIARQPEIGMYDVMLGTVFSVMGTLSYRDNKTTQTLLGTTERYAMINGEDIALGRFFSETEVRNKNRVVVIGVGVVEVLFPHLDPIGKSLRINGIPYTVVGVFAERALLLWGQTRDNRVILPYTAFHRDFGTGTAGAGGMTPQGTEMDIMAVIVPAQGYDVDDARDAITFVMRSRHELRPGEEDDFDIVSQANFLELWDQITGSVFLAMIVISSIALMVGGIGVMNIMLVSVTERTREIGVRKALGARRRDILWQFLIEAAVLTGIGGVFGVAIGSLLGAGVAKLISFPVSLPVWSFVIGVGASTAIGIFFGLFPANKAATLDPIEALRYE